jgi:uncharacterized membrane protein HdeD (DUF308 family)
MVNTEYEKAYVRLASDVDWKWLMALGIIMLIGGVIALFNPFAASLAVEFIAGAVFLIAGAVQLWLAFTASGQDTGDRWLSGILGAALILLAVALIANPLAGLVTLTLLVAVLFGVMGILRIALAFRARPREGWGWILASGILSLILAAVILVGLPGAAMGILGILLGIDLVMSGAVSLALAWRARSDG